MSSIPLSSPRLLRFQLGFSLFLLGLGQTVPVRAADASRKVPAPAGAGMIEGRVFNPGTGEYLEFVRITVEGTSLETFTDSAGEFRLANVPAGSATVTAFRTGVPPQSKTITVSGRRGHKTEFRTLLSSPVRRGR
jgi:hypothetical protein